MMMIIIIVRLMIKSKEPFRASTKDDILQPYITDDDFRYSNAGVVELDYNLYVFDIRYQQNFTASQPIRVEFKFDGVFPNDVNGYALVLTIKSVSVSSDGQNHFDLIYVILNFFKTLSFSLNVKFVFSNKASL